MGERVPAAGASLRRGVPRIERKEPAHRGIVAEYRRGVDVTECDLGVRRKDCFGALQRPRNVRSVKRNARCLNKCRQWIFDVGHMSLGHAILASMKFIELRAEAQTNRAAGDPKPCAFFGIYSRALLDFQFSTELGIVAESESR